MKSFYFLLTLVIASLAFPVANNYLLKREIMGKMVLANHHLMKKWPDPGAPVITDKERPSNFWNRAVYYEGLMALYSINPKKEYLQYTLDWAESHNWGLRNGYETKHAENHCAGQIYLDLYMMDPKPERIKDIKKSIDLMIDTKKTGWWYWIDALQMSMPVFAQLYVITGDDIYSKRMYRMFIKTKLKFGLYAQKDKLWFRDRKYMPPFKGPNGKNLYWSRGNGWVVAALIRVLDILPKDEPHRPEYLKTYVEMMEVLLPIQRTDGFWNVSLNDPDNFGGKETSGTALFIYGMAWGVNNGILDAKKYVPAITKGWEAMANEALHPNGFLGYVQGTGKRPSAGQPVSYTQKPNFEDFGIGCFLLAGSEVYKLHDYSARDWLSRLTALLTFP